MNHEFLKRLYGGAADRMKEWDPKYGNPHHELCKVKDLTVFFLVGEEMGIKVRVLAQAGEEYTATSSEVHEDSGGMPVGESVDFHTNIVPKGELYIEIANETRRMGEFYTRVDELSKQAKASTKSNHR